MITDLLVQQIESYLPYDPNRQQCELLQMLATFVLDEHNDTLFLLRGYAGTGKTSLVGALVKALAQLQSKVVLLAPTGRAAKVFARYAGHPAYTIHRRIYRQKSYSPDMEGFLVGENLAKHTLFIVDEGLDDCPTRRARVRCMVPADCSTTWWSMSIRANIAA